MTLGFLSRRGLWMERGVTITPRQAMPLGISGTFIVSLSSKVFVCYSPGASHPTDIPSLVSASPLLTGAVFIL